MANIDTNKPNIRFDIAKHTSTECLSAINTLIPQMNSDYKDKITALIKKSNNAWYGSIDAPSDIDLMKQIIGKGGAHLKRITFKYEAYIIWHDRTNNKFTVWGSKKGLISTLHALLRHITFSIKKQTELKQDVLKIEESMTVLTLPPQQEQETTTVHREREEDTDVVEPVAKKLRYGDTPTTN